MEKKLYEIEDLNCENNIESEEDLDQNETENKGRVPSELTFVQKKTRMKIILKRTKRWIQQAKGFL